MSKLLNILKLNIFVVIKAIEIIIIMSFIISNKLIQYYKKLNLNKFLKKIK